MKGQMGMKVVCIGSGYVGTVTGAAFAAMGHQTVLVDVDPVRVGEINAGIPPIYEPGLQQLIRMSVGKTLTAEVGYNAVRNADFVFIAVGTPAGEDGTADLRYVDEAARSIGAHLDETKFTVIVNKSTVPVGTAEHVASIVEQTSGLNRGRQFEIVSNPEFLREGFAIQDVLFPSRIVIGSSSDRARAKMRMLYDNLLNRVDYGRICNTIQMEIIRDGPRTAYFETDLRSAEMIKYASNAFLAIKISYINEVARLSEAIGANVLDVASGMGMDSRIGKQFLEVSSGWSGSCFPKDTAEFLATSRKHGSELHVVKAAIESNADMHRFVVDKLRYRINGLLGKRIGVLGLTFKPDTDDSRKTQATAIINQLLQNGAIVAVHDPKGMDMFRSLHPDLAVEYCDRAELLAVRAEALLLITHWDEYKALPWKSMFAQMAFPYILDTRNFLDRELLTEIGFIFDGLGVGKSINQTSSGLDQLLEMQAQ